MLIPDENELLRIIEPPRACSYLPEETATLEYRILYGISDEQYEQLLFRGWRRFGTHFFRPACANCVKCRSIRVDVAAFEPSKSQRRCEKKNATIRVEVDAPTITQAHLHLYNAYHASMRDEKGWKERATDREEYAQSFLEGQWPFSHEMRYYRGRELVGVGLVDVVPGATSSVYFYHAPDWRPDNPGTFSLLQEIALARQLGKRHLYLGYWIPENRSMNYKASFRPHQLLTSYHADEVVPQWQSVSDQSVRES
jgi:arginyl-tRNA--protein-N-Asp/Glu arginylyltransferase